MVWTADAVLDLPQKGIQVWHMTTSALPRNTLLFGHRQDDSAVAVKDLQCWWKNISIRPKNKIAAFHAAAP